MVNVEYKEILSDTGNGIITTTFRDNYIVKGSSYANEVIRDSTANLTEYFVLDASLCDCDRIFKLPISVNPSSGTVEVKFYEGTNSVGTTVLPLLNRNRLSANVAKTTLKFVPTVGTEKGTLLLQTLFGTDSAFLNSGGGVGSSANALILDPTKLYLFEVLYSDIARVGYNMEIVEV